MSDPAKSPPPEETKMEAYSKPKPMHIWRKFLKELAIILLGMPSRKMLAAATLLVGMGGTSEAIADATPAEKAIYSRDRFTASCVAKSRADMETFKNDPSFETSETIVLSFDLNQRRVAQIGEPTNTFVIVGKLADNLAFNKSGGRPFADDNPQVSFLFSRIDGTLSFLMPSVAINVPNSERFMYEYACHPA